MSNDLKDMPIESDLNNQNKHINNNLHDKESRALVNWFHAISFLTIALSVVIGLVSISKSDTAILGILIIAGGFIFSIFMRGFAQIISLLTDIKKNTSK